MTNPQRAPHLPLGEKRGGRLYGQHILSVKQFSREDIEAIFVIAEEMRTMVERVGTFDLLKGKLLASLFYEPSTRTSSSFTAAMERLGGTLGVAPRLWLIANAHDELPVELPPLQPLSQRSTVYDTAGNVIAIFERENQQPIVLSKVPAEVIAALLAVEDNEYWFHKGVNLRGFMRALLSNFASDAPTQGASTITQQVVKNEFLAGLPRDGRYKLLQAHYATMLEKEMTKQQILERYLNTVYFGNNAYGLQAAAEVYFGKDSSELSMVEGAFLAGLRWEF